MQPLLVEVKENETLNSNQSKKNTSAKCYDYETLVRNREIEKIQKRLIRYDEEMKINNGSRIYKCDKCKDDGIIYFFKEEYGEEIKFSKRCVCKIEEENKERIKRSGLEELFKSYTFENYIINEEYTETALNKALSFLKQTKKPFFFIGGQVGSGKTHLCTAICSELIKKYPLLFAEYKQIINDLKGFVCSNQEEYNVIANRLRNVTVLYIDDLFKTSDKGREYRIKSPDIEHMFNIINHRYHNNLTTIISSEMLSEEILDLDQGLGSRIIEKAITANIIRGEDRNYRLRNSRSRYHKFSYHGNFKQ